MENADFIIAINDQKPSLMSDIKSNKKISKILEQSNSMIVDIPKNASRTVWIDAANSIQTALSKLS